MDNSKPDIEAIEQILLDTGHKKYRGIISVTVMEKTPEEAASAFMLLDLKEELVTEEQTLLEDIETGQVWTIDPEGFDIKELFKDEPQTNLVHSMANLANLSHADMIWVILRFMGFAADTRTVTADEISRRLDSLIKTVTRSR